MLARLRRKQFQRATPALQRAKGVAGVRGRLRVGGEGRAVLGMHEPVSARANEERRGEVRAALRARARRTRRQLRGDRIRLLGAHTMPAPGIGGGGGALSPTSA